MVTQVEDNSEDVVPGGNGVEGIRTKATTITKKNKHNQQGNRILVMGMGKETHNSQLISLSTMEDNINQVHKITILIDNLVIMILIRMLIILVMHAQIVAGCRTAPEVVQQ